MRRRAAAAAFGAVLASASAGAAELRVEIDRVVVSGRIEPDDDLTLRRLVAENPAVRVVEFGDSTGGGIWATLFMGRAIRALGLATTVSGRCHSGCAYAFLGGVERGFEPGRAGRQAVLGFHGAFFEIGGRRMPAPHVASTLRIYVDEMTGGRVEAKLLARWLAIREADGTMNFLPPGGEGTRVFLCPPVNGRPAPAPYDRCETIADADALRIGIVTR
jgi:hypothetical protein